MRSFLPLIAVLTVAEAFVLSLIFDIEPLTQRTAIGAVAGAGGGLLPLLFISPPVLAVLRDDTLKTAVSELANVAVPWPRAVLALTLHAVAFAVFALSTAWLLAVPAPSTTAMVMWLLAVPFVPGAAWLVARPAVQWRVVLKRAGPGLCTGLVIAVLVMALAAIAASLWDQIYLMVLAPVHAILTVIASDIVYQPTAQNVGTARFLVNIAPECSGLEGIGLLVSLAILVVSQRPRAWPWPRTIALIFVAASLAWAANVVRIVVLILLGDAGHADIALGGFHSKAGWALYTAVGLMMLAALSNRQTDASASEDLAEVSPVAVFVGPVIAFTATGLLTSLVAVNTFDPWYGLRAVAAGAALSAAWRQIYGRARSTSAPSASEVRIPLADEGGGATLAQAVGWGILAYGIWLVLAPGPLTPALREGLATLNSASTTAWVAVRIVGAVLIVPWVEELAFRGYLLRRLIHPDFVQVPFGRFQIGAAIVSSLAFAALHGAFIAGFAAGIIYAAAQARGRSLKHAVIAHATTNALIVAQAFIEW
ncbi:MAG: CAAX prenyl protease-related protein [Myxococcota bacterium]